jgi:hypothetical protein
MVVYRTMANPAFVDRTIDPSDRDYGSLLSERPDLMNYAALGLARTCTPRAWLSTWRSARTPTWSPTSARAEPTLLVHAARDREIFPADIPRSTARSPRRTRPSRHERRTALRAGLGGTDGTASEDAPRGEADDVVVP